MDALELLIWVASWKQEGVDAVELLVALSCMRANKTQSEVAQQIKFIVITTTSLAGEEMKQTLVTLILQ